MQQYQTLQFNNQDTQLSNHENTFHFVKFVNIMLIPKTTQSDVNKTVAVKGLKIFITLLQM